MLTIVRSSIFYCGYFLSLMIFGVLGLPFLLLPRALGSRFIVLWNRFALLWLQWTCGIRYEVYGELDILSAPCVVISNHQSPWETIFLQLHAYPLTTVLKKELLRIPFFGWGLRLLNPIAIDRANPMQALKQIKRVGVERLKEGHSVLIFPEGTRQPADQLGAFARSGADIAKAAGVPVITIAHDAGHYWLNKQFLKHAGTIRVTVGTPIDVTDQNTKAVMEDIRTWMGNVLAVDSSEKSMP